MMEKIYGSPSSSLTTLRNTDRQKSTSLDENDDGLKYHSMFFISIV